MSQLLADNRHDFLLRLAHTACRAGYRSLAKRSEAAAGRRRIFLPASAWPDVQPAACRRTGGRTSCAAAARRSGQASPAITRGAARWAFRGCVPH
ncbi:MAG: hypothetical protein ACLR31_21510 [Escherichia coli]